MRSAEEYAQNIAIQGDPAPILMAHLPLTHAYPFGQPPPHLHSSCLFSAGLRVLPRSGTMIALITDVSSQRPYDLTNKIFYFFGNFYFTFRRVKTMIF